MLSLSTIVGDSMIESYTVQCTEPGSIRFQTVNYHSSPPHAVDVVFSGVVAHHFQDTMRASVIFDIEEVLISDLLAPTHPAVVQYYQQFSTYYQVDPSTSTAATVEFLQQRGIRGFEIVSSCGLCGWVLAADVAWFEPSA